MIYYVRHGEYDGQFKTKQILHIIGDNLNCENQFAVTEQKVKIVNYNYLPEN